MRQKIEIWIDTPEDVSLFNSVREFADELGSFFSTSARFEINTWPRAGKVNVGGQRHPNIGQAAPRENSNIGTGSIAGTVERDLQGNETVIGQRGPAY